MFSFVALRQQTWAAILAVLVSSAPWELPAEEQLPTPLTGAAYNEASSKLITTWQGYENEITTSRIEYIYLSVKCEDGTVTADDFANWILNAKLTESADPVRQVASHFSPAILDGDEDEVQARFREMSESRTVLFRGREQRQTGGFAEHVVLSDVHIFVDKDNRRITAYRVAGCPYALEHPDWFRIVPLQELSEDQVALTPDGEFLHLHEAEAGKIIQGGRLVVNAEDGLPRRVDLVDRAAGLTTRVEVYSDYAEHPGNVLFPGVRARATLENDHVARIDMTVIRDASFNSDITDEEFVLSAPAGWVWFDQRKDDQNSGVWPEDVKDVAVFFGGVATQVDAAKIAFPAERSTGFPWRSSLLIGNGLLLVLAGAVLWRRSQ